MGDALSTDRVNVGGLRNLLASDVSVNKISLAFLATGGKAESIFNSSSAFDISEW